MSAEGGISTMKLWAADLPARPVRPPRALNRIGPSAP
jgi:hypothetical protein